MLDVQQFNGSLVEGRSAQESLSEFKIRQSEIAVRAVSLRGGDAEFRKSWIRCWADTEDFQDYDGEGVRNVSQAYSPFDLLVLHGRDISRLGDIVREWRAMLGSKPIAVVADCADSDVRAAIYRAGADAVFDAEVEPAIAAAQVRAIVRRVMGEVGQGKGGDGQMAPISRAVERHLTRTERLIVDALWISGGAVSEYSYLLKSFGHEVNKNSIRNLHVRMCSIKNKIGNSVDIRNIKSHGYVSKFY